MTSKRKNLIVGAGVSGATLARKIAQDLDEQVVVVDAKPHIAGNCYDYRDNGIMVHKYGTHIFHTDIKDVWDFCSRFTKWYPYQHKVRGLIDGQIVPLPFNLNTLHAVFPKSMADKMENCLLENFGFNRNVPILELRKTEEPDLHLLAEYIYQKVFLGYTMKQWGQTPDEIDPSVTGRVPVRVSRDDRYFQDKYQGIPVDGFTVMIQKMLDHPNIKVLTGTPFAPDMPYDRLFHTGSVDEFFDYTLGKLPYRSIRLDFVRLGKPRFQEAAVVNYPCNYDWTRISEYKYFLDDQTKDTVVSFEYPEVFERGKNDRYYPVVSENNTALYNRYLALTTAQNMKNVYFFGRLGDYKYYDMDKAIARALALFTEVTR